MNRQDIIAMAEEAGMVTGENYYGADGYRYRSRGSATNVKVCDLERFAALVVAKDRQRLASDVELPEPIGFRTRYQSEPGMIGHYPWTYADQHRRRIDRPQCEYEDLHTADQLRDYGDRRAAAEREQIADYLEYGFVDDECHHIQYAAAIRARGQQ